MTSELDSSTNGHELEAFRQEVVDWLAHNLEGVGSPPDGNDTSEEEFERNHEFLRKLAKQGWYAPGWPTEFGGGGLPREKVEIVHEELDNRVPAFHNVRLPGDIGGGLAGPVWRLGTEEQKRRFLPPILKAETITWELFTEPEAGSDLPGMQSRAVRQGDEYVINGSKIFVGGNFRADQYFVLAVTDPDGSRHGNLSAFVAPSELSGLTVMPMEMMAGHKKNIITMDNVVVPAENRIGNEGDGWSCFGMGVPEFGTVGLPSSGERTLYVLDMLLDYARTTRRNGKRLIDGPRQRAAITNAWVGGQINRLLTERNRLLAMGGDIPGGGSHLRHSYQGAQMSLHRKLYQVELSEAIQQVLGPLSVIGGEDWAPCAGEFEYFQRQAIVNTHPGGTIETQKTRMFRGMASARSLQEIRASRR